MKAGRQPYQEGNGPPNWRGPANLKYFTVPSFPGDMINSQSSPHSTCILAPTLFPFLRGGSLKVLQIAGEKELVASPIGVAEIR